jgi:hypothetical protein
MAYFCSRDYKYNMRINTYRRITQILFILLIVLMPLFNILRFDSETRTLIVLGSAWELKTQLMYRLQKL